MSSRLRTRLRAGTGLSTPSLSLEFQTATGALDPRITFSRTSQATLVDSTGKLTYAPNNLLTNSETFEAAAWAKTGAGTGSAPTVTANTATAPDGTTTADTVTLNRGAGNTLSDMSYIVQTVSVATGASYMGSVYIKAAAAGDIGKQVAFRHAGSSTFLIITLTAAWVRVPRLEVASGTSASFELTSRGTITADNTVSFHVWGAQLEQVTYQTTPGTYNSTSPKNLLGYTQEFDNAAWPKQNATITANAVVAPDGSATADKLVEDTSNTSHRMYQTSPSAFANGTTVTNSVFLKAAERTWAYVRLELNDNTSLNAWFNLSSGVVGTVQSGLTASITSVGNGWYRCTVTGSVGTGASPARNYFLVGVTTADAVTNYLGNGTSGIYIWGAQLSNSASLDPYVYNPVAAPTSAAYYGPRFDYDPVTLANKGLLIEEQRTNLFTYSEQFDNAAWSKTAVTLTANAISSPDGTANAELVVATTTSALHLVSTALTVAAQTHTLSIYAKSAGYRFVMYTNNGGTNAARGFDLSNGTTFANTDVAYNDPTSWAITPIGNGWYRCSITFTKTSSVSCGFGLWLNNGSADTFAGNGTSGIYIYGAQLEAGSFATSYIPTVASQVTRTADVALMQGANFSNWYNQNEGTLFTSASQPTIFASSRTASSVNDSGTNRFNIYRQSAGGINGFMTPGAGVIASNVLATANTPWNAVLAYTTTTGFVSANGSAVVTAAHTVPLGVLNNLCIGNVAAAGAETFNGHIRRIGYYPTRLANAQLQSLTAQSTIPSLSLDFTTQVFNVG